MVMNTVEGGRAQRSQLRRLDGAVVPLPGDRWIARVDAIDAAVLDRAVGPVIDLGCGPGRHCQALAERGVVVLGIDLSTHAVGLARSKGVAVLERSVFETIPRAGEWGTVLLLDGNIGIGGDPGRLLQRAASLIHANGELLVEVDAAANDNITVRLEIDGEPGPWFDWASLGREQLNAVAGSAGLYIAESWDDDGRFFARLKRSL